MGESPELMPCPFCGGEASATNYIVEGAVRCSDCRASVSRTHGQYDEAGYEEAIAAWNTRADQIAAAILAMKDGRPMTPADLAAKGLRVKPLKWDETYYVVHASGSIEFFDIELNAASTADWLERRYYSYGDGVPEWLGDRLTKEYELWSDERKADHVTRIAAMIEETPHDQT
jgi:Lar family restriction alleviation protein